MEENNDVIPEDQSVLNNLPNEEVDETIEENDITETKINVCHICNTLLDTIKTEEGIHEDLKLYCVDCYKIDFKDYKMIWEEKIRNGCDNCSGVFKSESSVKNHPCSNLHWCTKCNLVFDQEKDLSTHYNICNIGPSLYFCNICTESFSDKSKFEFHSLMHSSGMPYLGNDSETFSFSSINQRALNSGQRPYTCEICFKSYRQKRYLKNHLLTHTSDNPYICNICSKALSTSSSLQRHILIHIDGTSYTCPVCSKSLTSLIGLKRHSLKHSGIKPFACTVCSKSFVRKSHLERHLIIHTGERPFVCHICSKAFNQKSILNAHLITHTIEKPYCDICSKTFNSVINLERHYPTHTSNQPFTCEICSQTFTRIYNLKRHLITHTGVKPYSCEYCSKSFARTYLLKRHLVSHIGENRNACDVSLTDNTDGYRMGQENAC